MRCISLVVLVLSSRESGLALGTMGINVFIFFFSFLLVAVLVSSSPVPVVEGEVDVSLSITMDDLPCSFYCRLETPKPTRTLRGASQPDSLATKFRLPPSYHTYVGTLTYFRVPYADWVS
ncbi:uncharacterized protein BT62DRAFT_709626 [Guyanagaster necrorhizus]|uniref:Uncharacterized protein n=1 Tax=Guyanagaster necrorhizus TaxID=856835 RepID=A0A9P7VYD9_9AGAR|nr:uncharacterized protein BT62DRAFT_709626 [Guyanagaster necrorhizus MCA 3950]KAG7448499.1 hypothetical protein BT62DRAFT_709626 [Guyanagaster necrorhizus MCA 3950]